MAFLGNQPAAQFTTIPTVQRFNGTGSATEFTLDRTVASVQSIMVSVDGVIQDTSSYTIPDGVTLTFSSAPSSGTGNIFINYLGLVLGTVTHPSTSSLSATSGTFSGDLDVDGITNLDVVDIDGALTQDGGAVFNEGGADVDFRVESNNNAFMLVVDGGTDNVLIGTGTVRNGGLLSIDFNSAADGGIGINDTASGNGAGFIGFLTGGTFRGAITNNNNTAVAYNTTSDYRLKENVSYSFDATTRLKQLKPARFNWIADSDNTVVDGFLAHEVSSIVPEAITGDKDETKTTENVVLDVHENIIGSDVTEVDWLKGKVEGVYDSNSTWRSTITQKHYQQIDQSKLVPLLVKTIQELEARITALENK